MTKHRTKMSAILISSNSEIASKQVADTAQFQKGQHKSKRVGRLKWKDHTYIYIVR